MGHGVIDRTAPRDPPLQQQSPEKKVGELLVEHGYLKTEEMLDILSEILNVREQS